MLSDTLRLMLVGPDKPSCSQWKRSPMRYINQIWLKIMRRIQDGFVAITDDTEEHNGYAWSREEFFNVVAERLPNLRKGMGTGMPSVPVVWYSEKSRQYANPGLAVKLETKSVSLLFSVPTDHPTRQVGGVRVPLSIPIGLRGPSEHALLGRASTNDQFAAIFMSARNSQCMRRALFVRVMCHMVYSCMAEGMTWKKATGSAGFRDAVLMHEISPGYCLSYLCDGTDQAQELYRRAKQEIDLVKVTESNFGPDGLHIGQSKRKKECKKWRLAIQCLSLERVKRMLELTERAAPDDLEKCRRVHRGGGGTPEITSGHSEVKKRIDRLLESDYERGLAEVVSTGVFTEKWSETIQFLFL